MTRHLLVTNDFPPKIGGIQSYLWELWRRLPPDEVAVYTTPYPGAAAFDARQRFPIERSPEPVIGPFPWLAERIDRHAGAVRADRILVDPAIPLGAIAPRFGLPYGVVLHGAEVTVPARLPVTSGVLRTVLRGADLVVAAGAYALAEAERCCGRPLPAVVVPPGVDTSRFEPPDPDARRAARRAWDVADDEFCIASVNRLVPRKGMHLLVAAVVELDRRLRRDPTSRWSGAVALLGGDGRHRRALTRQIGRTGAPVRLVGRLSDPDVVRLYRTADAMAMLCHDRWRGLEQEGFGIAFVEAAATGVPQVAGRSGGAHEAVVNGATGFVVDDPSDTAAVADALEMLARDDDLRRSMGEAARRRAVTELDYDVLARRLADAIDAWRHDDGGSRPPGG